MNWTLNRGVAVYWGQVSFFGNYEFKGFESGLPVLIAIVGWLGISILTYKMLKPTTSISAAESQNSEPIKSSTDNR
jgi:hypothetical protein